ncbi:MAG: Spy/CpxP family protein refolding chaperone [Roseateles sp.]
MNHASFFRPVAAALIASSLALTGLAAQAQPKYGHHGGPARMAPGAMFGGHLLELANVSDAQRSQIEAIYKAARQDLAGQREAGRKLHEQMLKLYTATNVDAVAIEAVRAQMAAQHEAASKRLTQASVEAARVLSPEQRTKIAEALKKRHARMAERAQRHAN